MFREGRHVEKNNRRFDKIICFFIDCSWIFHEKSMEDSAKSVKTVFVHKNRQTIRLERPFSAKKRFLMNFWDFRPIQREFGSIFWPKTVPRGRLCYDS